MSEFRCKSGASMGTLVVENIKELANNLQVLRDYLGVPITITSGYRSKAHNKAIGGAEFSKHVIGQAADIKAKGLSPSEIKQAIQQLIAEGKMKQGGIGLYRSWVHYDIRGTKARW